MSQYARDLKHILATLSEQGGNEYDETPLPDEEEGETIHVYPVEGGGLLFTRTPLDDGSEEAPAPIIDSQPPTPSRATYAPSLFVLFLLLLCLFVVGDMADSQLVALLVPTATIALTPQVRSLTLSSTATLGKFLSPITLTQSETVPATGHGHQEARAATGTLTFYNGQLQSVTVPAGTVLTSGNGVQIVTAQGAVIPSADPATNPPAFGQTSVVAQAVQIGARGNITAFAVSGPCCAASVLVKNLTAFTGGQDARDYPIVTTSDRDRAAESVRAKVAASMTAALQGQLLPGQALHPQPCTPATSANHAPGEEAVTVTVTVSETCTAVAYDPQQVQAWAAQILTTQAAHTLGAGYLLTGDVRVSVTKATTTTTTPGVVLTFTSTGTFAYTFTAQAQQHLKTLLAGKPRLVALHLLLQQPGIRTASISGIPDNQPLPDDLSHLHLLILLLVL